MRLKLLRVQSRLFRQLHLDRTVSSVSPVSIPFLCTTTYNSVIQARCRFLCCLKNLNPVLHTYCMAETKKPVQLT